MTSPRTLLSAWNLRPKKRLGQHFLSDPARAAQIVCQAAVSGTDTVLEIGAGLGSLTLPLARQVRRVYAVETDPQLIPLLTSELTSAGLSNVSILPQDILRLDFTALERNGNDALVVMGNLPYNISSQILIRLIQWRQGIKHAVIMLQHDLARRLVSPPGSRQYGRISVLVQYCSELKIIDCVPPGCFFPRPAVESAVLFIRFHNGSRLAAADERLFFKTVKAAFAKRRKTLKNALSQSELELDADQASAALTGAGIDPGRRAETLTVEEFLALTERIRSLAALQASGT